MANRAQQAAEDQALCDLIHAHYAAHRYAFQARGWAYFAEQKGIIGKSEFKSFEARLARLRKQGMLDPDVVNDDATRVATFGEQVDLADPEEQATAALDAARSYLDTYTPISFWDGLPSYVEVVAEKADGITVGREIFQRYCVTTSPTKGSSDVNGRRRLLLRAAEHILEGRNVVILYLGDCDPYGGRMARDYHKNLLDCARLRDVAQVLTPMEIEDEIKVVTLGLTPEQVDDLGLPWIDNLETSSGRSLVDYDVNGHPVPADIKGLDRPLVQRWLDTIGERKCELNALAFNIVGAQQLLEQALLRYIPEDWPEIHQQRLEPHREKAREAFRDLRGGV